MLLLISTFINMFLCVCGIDTEKTSIIGDIKWTKTNYMAVNCYDEPFENVSFTPFNDTKYINFVQFTNCPASNVTYSSKLEELNVDFDVEGKLTLYYEHKFLKEPFRVMQFEGMTINRLSIVNYPRLPTMEIKSTEFFNFLPHLDKFNIDGFILPPLPDKASIKKIWLFQGKSTGEFGGCEHVEDILLNTWKLEGIPDKWLVRCNHLATLELWNINLSTDLLRKLVEGMNSLQTLVINHCNFGRFPFELSTFTRNLQELQVWNNSISKLTLRSINIRYLEALTVDEKVEDLEGLPQRMVKNFSLNLAGSPVKRWEFLKLDYEMLKENEIVGVTSQGMSLDCDCQHGWLARAVRDQKLVMSDMRPECDDGSKIQHVPQHVVECDKFKCEGCICRRQWSDNTTVARCDGTTTRVPRVLGLQALYAARNLIDTLHADDLPDTLITLDLARNRLSSIDFNATVAMFSVRKRRIRLRGNPLACTCGNQYLIEMLQNHRMQIEDYNKVTCTMEDQRLAVRDVVASELCAERIQQQRNLQLSESLGIFAAILGVAAITAVFYWRYRQHIKVYLYAHGYCLWCIREDEVDSDRYYDAFVSFSHEDEQFVIEELLPTLDSEYKICVHFRDWVVGEFIPAQISRSVRESRRTIIILSKNFVESEWGVLEFHTAHESALLEGRARVIVIVLDDVVEEEHLSAEFRSYVRTNTYVKWGDKWFWEKLRYVMPHHRTTSNTVNQPTVVNNQGSMNPLVVPMVDIVP